MIFECVDAKVVWLLGRRHVASSWALAHSRSRNGFLKRAVRFLNRRPSKRELSTNHIAHLISNQSETRPLKFQTPPRLRRPTVSKEFIVYYHHGHLESVTAIEKYNWKIFIEKLLRKSRRCRRILLVRKNSRWKWNARRLIPSPW